MAAIRMLLATVASLCGMCLAVPIVGLGLPFWLVAFLTSRLSCLFEPRVVSWNQLIEFEPTVGWKPKAGLSAYCVSELGGDVFHVTSDAQGWPGRTTLSESEMVVFGDSFAFGYGVNAKALFSELNPTLRMKAIGAPGYNMVQELLWMSRLATHLRNKLVVWFIYVGNDLVENLQPNMQDYRTPFVRRNRETGAWEIVTRHIQPAKWWHYRLIDHLRAQERFAGVFGSTFLSERIYSACAYLIGKGEEICQRVGARLVVMTIPRPLQLSPRAWAQAVSPGRPEEKLDPDQPDRRIGEICRKLGVVFVPGKDHLDVSDYIPGDGHWNARGHGRIAAVLQDLYAKRQGL